jgi:peptidyl-prolyl cis-trans isomerase SurA
VFSRRLAEQARNGTPFQGLAQQFSQSATAAIGGDLGWIHFGELEIEIDRAITTMKAGDFSEPIRTISGYTIVHLREERTTAEVSPYMAAITLSQIYLNTSGPNKLSRERLDQLSLAIEQQITNCPQMNDWAEEIGAPGSGPIEMIRIGALPEKIRDSIVTLPAGKVSPPIEVTGAKLYVLICQREEDDGLPSSNQVYSQLESQKLDVVARQRLRDLRREALIDIRL